MQRHANDWAGVIKAALPYLRLLQADVSIPETCTPEISKLGEVIEEGQEVLANHDAMMAMGPAKPPTFIGELESLVNRYSMENASDTPDFILAGFMQDCLNSFNLAVNGREKWYGREMPENAPKS